MTVIIIPLSPLLPSTRSHSSMSYAKRIQHALNKRLLLLRNLQCPQFSAAVESTTSAPCQFAEVIRGDFVTSVAWKSQHVSSDPAIKMPSIYYMNDHDQFYLTSLDCYGITTYMEHPRIAMVCLGNTMATHAHAMRTFVAMACTCYRIAAGYPGITAMDCRGSALTYYRMEMDGVACHGTIPCMVCHGTIAVVNDDDTLSPHGNTIHTYVMTALASAVELPWNWYGPFHGAVELPWTVVPWQCHGPVP